ncbi:hypothetical protein F4677DRAFT_461348 [Hypoxylon crocopeplum]|nr:hypothetical protein F4677DRAFT_461348 [Hypoxylon crocopeplum]
MAPPYQRGVDDPQPGACSDIATITVPSGRTFGIHAHLLAHYSDYFLRALNGNSEKAKTQNFDMSLYATEATLDMFVGWIYAKSTAIYHKIFDSMNIDTLGYDNSPDDLVEAWLFGEHIEPPEFKDTVLMLIYRYAQVEGFDNTYPWAFGAWDRIPAKSRLRPFLVDLLCEQLGECSQIGLIDAVDILPDDIALEIFKRLIHGQAFLFGKVRFELEEYLL